MLRGLMGIKGPTKRLSKKYCRVVPCRAIRQGRICPPRIFAIIFFPRLVRSPNGPEVFLVKDSSLRNVTGVVEERIFCATFSPGGAVRECHSGRRRAERKEECARDNKASSVLIWLCLCPRKRSKTAVVRPGPAAIVVIVGLSRQNPLTFLSERCCYACFNNNKYLLAMVLASFCVSSPCFADTTNLTGRWHNNRNCLDR